MHHFIFISEKNSTETPGQRYNQDSIYESLALITMELEIESEAENSTCWIEEFVS